MSEHDDTVRDRTQSQPGIDAERVARITTELSGLFVLGLDIMAKTARSGSRIVVPKGYLPTGGFVRGIEIVEADVPVPMLAYRADPGR